MTPDPRTPVIVVHGYLAPRILMLPMQWQLRQAGFRAFTVDLPFLNLASVDACTDRLIRGIDAILVRTGQTRCDIVGASLGGLMALHYVRNRGGAPRVRRLVAIGTPFKGTWSALPAVGFTLGLSPSALECLPNSEFIASLTRGPLPDGPEYVSIYGSFDPIAPKASCILEGARNVEIRMCRHPLAHQTLVISPVVMQRLKEALA